MSRQKTGESARSVVQSVTRALLLLEIIAQENGAISVSKLAEKAKLKIATVHRLLNTMKDRGFVEQDPLTLHYRFGIKMIETGSAAFAANDLRTMLRPYLRQLRQDVNETVNLAVLDDTEVVYIDQLESSNMIVVKMFAKLGSRGPAYCTGSGKVLLAELPGDELQKRFATVRFVKYTPHTIDNVADLRKELEKVRQNGYALDYSERDEGVICVAAPIKNHEGVTQAAISVSAPLQRMPVALIMERVLPALMDIAAAASKKVGYYGQE